MFTILNLLFTSTLLLFTSAQQYYVATVTNTVNNSVQVFTRTSSNGRLVFKGSYPTQGRGDTTRILIGTSHCLAKMTAADGSYLIACNAGSREITLFKVLADGALTFIEKKTTRGHPAAIAVYGSAVYVAVQTGTSSFLPSYQGFTFKNGKLTPLCVYTMTARTIPVDVQFAAAGTRLIGTRRTGSIDTFSVMPGMCIKPIITYNESVVPFGMAVSPINSNWVYVTTANNGNGTGGAFSVSFTPSVPVIIARSTSALAQSACWAVATMQYTLWVTFTGLRSLGLYRVNRATGAATFFTSFIKTRGRGPTDLDMSADGSRIYTIDSAAIDAFAIQPSITVYNVNQTGASVFQTVPLYSGGSSADVKTTIPMGLVVFYG